MSDPTDLTLFEGDNLPQIVTELDTARVSKNAPLTSHWAGDASAKTVQPSRTFVLFILAELGPLSQPELINVAHARDLHFSDSRMRSAVSELREDGLVEFTGFYHTTQFGNRTQVWQLTGGDAA